MLATARSQAGMILHRPKDLARAIPPLLRTVAIRAEHFSGYSIMAALYLIRGAHGHALVPLEKAMRRELADPMTRFIGALPQRAVAHIASGELDAARALLDQAIQRYTGHEQVYAPALLAYVYCARGWLEERHGNDAAARRDFEHAIEIAEAHEHVVSIGAHWVKAHFGLARTLFRQGDSQAARRALDDAAAVFDARARFAWNVFVGASDAEVLYERASALAALGRADDARDMLRRAAQAGWADATWLHGDPAFAALRDSDAIKEVCIDAANMVTLPPPVGDGGLDDE